MPNQKMPALLPQGKALPTRKRSMVDEADTGVMQGGPKKQTRPAARTSGMNVRGTSDFKNLMGTLQQRSGQKTTKRSQTPGGKC